MRFYFFDVKYYTSSDGQIGQADRNINRIITVYRPLVCCWEWKVGDITSRMYCTIYGIAIFCHHKDWVHWKTKEAYPRKSTIIGHRTSENGYIAKKVFQIIVIIAIGKNACFDVDE